MNQQQQLVDLQSGVSEYFEKNYYNPGQGVNTYSHYQTCLTDIRLFPMGVGHCHPEDIWKNNINLYLPVYDGLYILDFKYVGELLKDFLVDLHNYKFSKFKFGDNNLFCYIDFYYLGISYALRFTPKKSHHPAGEDYFSIYSIGVAKPDYVYNNMAFLFNVLAEHMPKEIAKLIVRNTTDAKRADIAELALGDLVNYGDWREWICE